MTAEHKRDGFNDDDEGPAAEFSLPSEFPPNLTKFSLTGTAIFLDAAKYTPLVHLTQFSVQLDVNSNAKRLFDILPNITLLTLLTWNDLLPEGPQPQSLTVYRVDVADGGGLRGYEQGLLSWSTRSGLQAMKFAWPISLVPVLEMLKRMIGERWSLSTVSTADPAPKQSGISLVDLDTLHPKVLVTRMDDVDIGDVTPDILAFADRFRNLVLSGPWFFSLADSQAKWSSVESLVLVIHHLEHFQQSAGPPFKREPTCSTVPGSRVSHDRDPGAQPR